MEVHDFEIVGPKLISGSRFSDERGYFSETFQEVRFKNLGLPPFVQDNLSLSGPEVFRGLHWQMEPHAQGKLVTCLRGAIIDLLVDIRKSSPTFGKHLSIPLDDQSLKSVWVPPGFAHGFLSLDAGTLVHYKVSALWSPEYEKSLNCRPFFGSEYSTVKLVLSAKDLSAPTLEEILEKDPDSLFQ